MCDNRKGIEIYIAQHISIYVYLKDFFSIAVEIYN